MHRRRVLRAAAGCGAALLLGACGQKGPLFLHDERFEKERQRIEEEKKKRKSSATGAPVPRA